MDTKAFIEVKSDEESQNLLEIKNLSVEIKKVKYRQKKILDNINFSIKQGEVLGVVGTSGSGKSILVRSVLGLLPESLVVTSGSIKYRETEIVDCPEKVLTKLRGQEIAPILPDAKMQLNPVIRIGKFIEDVARVNNKRSKREAKEIAIKALRNVGINDPEMRMQAYPHELSGGMAQRVCIAIALMHNPNLIIADEPTFGLDVTVQRSVLDQMRRLILDRKAAQIIVTRDLGIVAHYCERVIIMHDGTIVESGTIEEIFNNPKSEHTRHLLESVEYVPN